MQNSPPHGKDSGANPTSPLKRNFRVAPITSKETYPWLLKKHYAKRIPSITKSFGLYKNNNLVGVCTFGIPPQENCMLLCGEEFKERVLELNRLVKNDGLEKNVQSFFVSRCLMQLNKPMIILSYADPNYGHNGYTYQALNFFYTGEGGSGKEYIFQNKQYTARHIKDYWFKSFGLIYDPSLPVDLNFTRAGGEIVEMKPKRRYVYFVGDKKQKKDMLSKLKWPVLKYPKGDNKRYDASYKPETQRVFF